jgi:hypothetical protein
VVKKNKAAAALGKKGGKAGTGKAKARTTEQARAAAKTRWIKKEIQEIEEVMKSDEYVFSPRLDDDLRELYMQLAELKLKR